MIEIPEATRKSYLANSIITVFINDRLKDMMESMFEMILDVSYKKIDFDELMFDKDFAEEVRDFLPANYPLDKVNQEFIGLYKLMLSKDEHIMPLPMQYILYELIYRYIDYYEDSEDCEELCYKRISEPFRRYLCSVFEEDSDEDLSAEEIVEMYEDIRKYPEVCFYDWDHLLLDEVSEDELVNSVVGECLGITKREDIEKNDIQLDGQEVHIEVNNAPWNKD